MSYLVMALLEVDDTKIPYNSDFYGEIDRISQSDIRLIDNIQLDSMSTDYATNLFKATKSHACAANYIFANIASNVFHNGIKNRIR